MLTAVRTATRVSNCLSKNEILSLSCLSFKRDLDTDYNRSWLERISSCLQKEWKGCFPRLFKRDRSSRRNLHGDWENQSHFDDYPEKGKSLIDITVGGLHCCLVVLFLVVFRSNYLLLCCCSNSITP